MALTSHTWLEGSGLATDSPRLEPRPVRRPVLAASILPAVTQGVTSAFNAPEQPRQHSNL